MIYSVVCSHWWNTKRKENLQQIVNESVCKKKRLKILKSNCTLCISKQFISQSLSLSTRIEKHSGLVMNASARQSYERDRVLEPHFRTPDYYSDCYSIGRLLYDASDTLCRVRWKHIDINSITTGSPAALTAPDSPANAIVITHIISARVIMFRITVARSDHGAAFARNPQCARKTTSERPLIRKSPVRRENACVFLSACYYGNGEWSGPRVTHARVLAQRRRRPRGDIYHGHGMAFRSRRGLHAAKAWYRCAIQDELFNVIRGLWKEKKKIRISGSQPFWWNVKASGIIAREVRLE